MIRRDRSSGRAINLMLIVGTLATNWVLLFASPVRLWGLYLLLVFAAALLVIDVVRLTTATTDSNAGGSIAAASFMQNDLRLFILIWIFWLVVTEFFFLSRTWFNVWLALGLELPMLVATFIVSLQQHGQRVARIVFPLLALLALAFPAREWMPQHEWWPAGVVRVALFFFAVLIAGYAVPHRELRFDVVRAHVVSALAMHPKTRHDVDEEDVERTLHSQTFSATVAECQNVCIFETERTLTIVALSVWILLVPRVVILFFGLFLVVVQLVIFFVRRSEYEKITSMPKVEAAGSTATSAAAQTNTLATSTTSVVAAADKTSHTAVTVSSTITSAPTASQGDDDDDDDNATDEGDASIEAATDTDEASNASDSLEHPPLPQPPPPGAAQIRPHVAHDVAHHAPTTTESPWMVQRTTTSAAAPRPRVTTKILTIK